MHNLFQWIQVTGRDQLLVIMCIIHDISDPIFFLLSIDHFCHKVCNSMTSRLLLISVLHSRRWHCPFSSKSILTLALCFCGQPICCCHRYKWAQILRLHSQFIHGKNMPIQFNFFEITTSAPLGLPSVVIIIVVSYPDKYPNRSGLRLII